ncbi:hypothetical protein EDB84DRAFT_1443139 [Lactarius hengduanensis]|nr:hypothetical protein EDB84DRAFT_1443139 [Lactarius hengduanensis]
MSRPVIYRDGYHSEKDRQQMRVQDFANAGLFPVTSLGLRSPASKGLETVRVHSAERVLQSAPVPLRAWRDLARVELLVPPEWSSVDQCVATISDSFPRRPHHHCWQFVGPSISLALIPSFLPSHTPSHTHLSAFIISPAHLATSDQIGIHLNNDDSRAAPPVASSNATRRGPFAPLPRLTSASSLLVLAFSRTLNKATYDDGDDSDVTTTVTDPHDEATTTTSTTARGNHDNLGDGHDNGGGVNTMATTAAMGNVELYKPTLRLPGTGTRQTRQHPPDPPVPVEQIWQFQFAYRVQNSERGKKRGGARVGIAFVVYLYARLPLLGLQAESQTFQNGTVTRRDYASSTVDFSVQRPSLASWALSRTAPSAHAQRRSGHESRVPPAHLKLRGTGLCARVHLTTGTGTAQGNDSEPVARVPAGMTDNLSTYDDSVQVYFRPTFRLRRCPGRIVSSVWLSCHIEPNPMTSHRIATDSLALRLPSSHLTLTARQAAAPRLAFYLHMTGPYLKVTTGDGQRRAAETGDSDRSNWAITTVTATTTAADHRTGTHQTLQHPYPYAWVLVTTGTGPEWLLCVARTRVTGATPLPSRRQLAGPVGAYAINVPIVRPHKESWLRYAPALLTALRRGDEE